MKKIVGIDFSKANFDAVIGASGEHLAFSNNAQGFKQFDQWIRKRLVKEISSAHIVMEHTGIYSFLFEKFLYEKEISFSKVSGLQIKKSAGMLRGKSDKADARMIAKYGTEKQHELKKHSIPSQAVLKLKNLVNLRDKFVRDRAGYIARSKEQKEFLRLTATDVLIQSQRLIIEAFTKEIERIEKEIKEVIKSDKVIEENFKLLTSIKGVGLVVSAYVIAFTENFTTFDTWRQFACYVGIAPFPYKSGTSIRGKTQISHYGYKKLKSLLHLSALSAIQYNHEMKKYYENRTEKGKNKMSTLNVIRNKMLSRMFAVVERKSEYQTEWLKAA